MGSSIIHGLNTRIHLPSGMSDSPTGKALYLVERIGRPLQQKAVIPSDYTWSLIKGEKGDTGIQGPKGTDGKTTYTWVRYAASARWCSICLMIHRAKHT